MVRVEVTRMETTRGTVPTQHVVHVEDLEYVQAVEVEEENGVILVITQVVIHADGLIVHHVTVISAVLIVTVLVDTKKKGRNKSLKTHCNHFSVTNQRGRFCWITSDVITQNRPR